MNVRIAEHRLGFSSDPCSAGFWVRRECAGQFRGTSFCNRRERILPSDKEQSMAKGQNQRKETKKPKKDKK